MSNNRQDFHLCCSADLQVECSSFYIFQHVISETPGNAIKTNIIICARTAYLSYQNVCGLMKTIDF